MEDPNPLSPDVAAVILKLVARAAEPLTASRLCGLLTGPFRTTSEDLAEHLADLVRQGKLHLWPPRTVRSTPRYWHHRIESCIREALPQALAAGPLTRGQLDEALRRRLFGLSRQPIAALREDALAPLLAGGGVFEHPPRGRFPVRFGCRPPDPREYLSATRRELEKVCRRLSRAGVGRDEILASLAGFLGVSAVPIAPLLPHDSADTPRALLQAMEAVEPAARNQALVTVPALRRAMGLPKVQFDAMVLAMADQGRLFLHEHIYPGQLSEKEREALVDDGRGGYIMGVVWREGGGDG